MSSAEVTADKCPVDHKTRQAWLDKAQYKLEDLDHIEPELSALPQVRP